MALSSLSRSSTFIYFNKNGDQSNWLSQAITGQGFWLLLTTFGTGLWKTFPFPLVNDRLFSLGKRHSTQSWWNFSLVMAGSWDLARSLDLDLAIGWLVSGRKACDMGRHSTSLHKYDHVMACVLSTFRSHFISNFGLTNRFLFFSPFRHLLESL